MHQAIQMSDTLWYLGSSDRRLAKFENCHPVPLGISYNSYLVMDEKTVLLDTVDHSICGIFLENIKSVLNGRPLDYIIVNHMEPDHCATLAEVLLRYPEATVVGSAKTHAMIKQFFGDLNLQGKVMQVKENDTLSTGHHNFRFILAPMVHWPEVTVTYDETEKILFSADAFGTVGALSGNLYADQLDFGDFELSEMRRYYSNIVGKYGLQVQALLNKAAGLDIQMICPLHGPVWRSNIDWILQKYQKWTTWTPEEEGYTIVYGSMYGHTASAAEAAAAYIQKKSGKPVRVYDVSETHTSYLISEIWRFSRVLLFCPTYNGGIYPEMEALVRDIIALGVQNRIFGLAENGSWAPQAGKKIQKELEALKNCKVAEDILSFKGALHEADEERMQAWADAVMSATLS